MELRWPRSSGGSLRSLTASIKPDRRSLIFKFFSVLDDEEYAHRPYRLEISAVEFRNIDDETALASRVAMAHPEIDSTLEGLFMSLRVRANLDTRCRKILPRGKWRFICLIFIA